MASTVPSVSAPATHGNRRIRYSAPCCEIATAPTNGGRGITPAGAPKGYRRVQTVSAVDNRPFHEWDDDACCIHCGYDGAEAWWLQSRLRIEIGDDEFNYRRSTGEFDSSTYCKKRESAG